MIQLKLKELKLNRFFIYMYILFQLQYSVKSIMNAPLCEDSERERDEAEVSVMFVFTGGWALNRKELKLIQTIGKGEFGGA